MINMDLDDLGKEIKAPVILKPSIQVDRTFNDKGSGLFGGKVGGSVISGEELFSMQEPETSRNNQVQLVSDEQGMKEVAKD